MWFSTIKKFWRRYPEKLSIEQTRKLKSFFLNNPKEMAVKHHPHLAWAYHVHGMMISFYEDVLETTTFCENTQMRSWQKANLVALAVLEDKPLPFSFEAKKIILDEIHGLREDIHQIDRDSETSETHLAIQRYLSWSHIYFEHFPSQGLQQEPLEQIDMLAEQAAILAHPYVSPSESRAYKLYTADLCLKQLAWELPFYHTEELPTLIKHAVSQEITGAQVLADIAHNQALATRRLKSAPSYTQPSSERIFSLQKINELQSLLTSPSKHSWSKLNKSLIDLELACNSISKPSRSPLPSSGVSPSFS